MSRPALTIFILFFGIAFIDAIRGGDWPRILFWIAIGAAFWYLERRELRRTPRPGSTTPGLDR